MLDLSEISQTWELAPILSARAPETGTIHQTLLLNTAEGSYALRAYRYTADERERIVNEHALICYVAARGLPVPVPRLFADGEQILERAGRFYALFPFAAGQQVARKDLTEYEALAMGEFLGRLHQVLRDYPRERVAQRNFTVDSASTFAALDTIEAAIRALPGRRTEDEQALLRLSERRKWLTTTPIVPLDDFLALERQVIHGDYQETNLFFAAGQVSAVIDWDQSYVAPRAWEVVRAFHYSLKLQGALCRAFLEGYRRVLPLTLEELEIAAAAYGWKRAHDLWHYKELYLAGNQRVRAFFQPAGPSISFGQRWTDVQDFLRTNA